MADMKAGARLLGGKNEARRFDGRGVLALPVFGHPSVWAAPFSLGIASIGHGAPGSRDGCLPYPVKRHLGLGGACPSMGLSCCAIRVLVYRCSLCGWHWPWGTWCRGIGVSSGWRASPGCQGSVCPIPGDNEAQIGECLALSGVIGAGLPLYRPIGELRGNAFFLMHGTGDPRPGSPAKGR